MIDPLGEPPAEIAAIDRRHEKNVTAQMAALGLACDWKKPATQGIARGKKDGGKENEKRYQDDKKRPDRRSEVGENRQLHQGQRSPISRSALYPFLRIMQALKSEKRIAMIGAMNKSESLFPHSDLLRTFLVVAECENGTHAADMLGRTQSAISVRIRRLEDILCVNLFERRARGMTLTGEGRKLMPAARRIVSDLQRIGTLFDTPLRGRIRVGIPDDYAETVLENAFVEFAQLHSEVEIFTRAGCTSGFADAVRREELDIAICSGPHVSAGEAISSEPNIWAASDGFELKDDAPIPLALLDRNCWWRDIPTDALNHAGRDWKLVYSSENFASVKAAIRAGLAVGVLPQSIIEPAMTHLSERDGFPELPPSKRSIIIADNASSDLANAMAAALRKAIQRSG